MDDSPPLFIYYSRRYMKKTTADPNKQKTVSKKSLSWEERKRKKRAGKKWRSENRVK